MNLASKLNQKATWWAKTGEDGYRKPSFAAPVTVDCRWEDWRSLSPSPTMEELRITARIFLNFHPTVGDCLAEGECTDADPSAVSGARFVLRVTKMGTVDAQVFLYVAALYSG